MRCLFQVSLFITVIVFLCVILFKLVLYLSHRLTTQDLNGIAIVLIFLFAIYSLWNYFMVTD
jgi:hypothetical protein